MKPQLQDWEDAFFRLHDWLEEDRDRRAIRISADNYDLWWAALYIDHHCVSAERGFDLPEVIAEVMRGMIVSEREGSPADDLERATAEPAD